tara:strand:+ start:88 stop:711 length:624 start_codon:yes stop_codon:yes gene_type:complete
VKKIKINKKTKKKIGYIEYNLNYFQKNIKIKDMCDYHIKFGAGTSLIHGILCSVAFDRSKKEEKFEFSNPNWHHLDDLITKNENNFWKPKNKKFVELIEKHEWAGTLLPLISKNFKLIYKFEFDDLLAILIYSKYGDQYYYIPQKMYYDKKTKDRYTDCIGEAKIFKKKPTKKKFLSLFLHPKDMLNKEFLKSVIALNGVPFEYIRK